MSSAMETSRRRVVAKRTLNRAINRVRSKAPMYKTAPSSIFSAKRLDQGISSSTVGTTSQVSYLSGLVAGAGIGQRNGNKVQLKSIAVRGWVSGNPTATSHQTYRVIWFYDKGNQGAIPSGSDYFTTDGALQFMNQYNTDRFVTIRSFLFESWTNSDISHNIEFYHKFKKPLILNYASGSSNVSDARANALFFLIVGTDNTNLGGVSFQYRLTYYDA